MKAAFSTRNLRSLEALSEVLLPEGHGLPGATSVGVAAALGDRARWWKSGVSSRVRWLLRAWEWAPLFSRRLKPFSRLDGIARAEWVESAYRSRLAARRLHLAALKQLIFLVWASTPTVEDAIGYDYRCRKDDEPHGAARTILGEPRMMEPGPEPDDYLRPGPAVAAGAVPLERVLLRDFVSGTEAPLTTTSWPDLGDGMRERADVVVVGSGAGGSVVAAYLAEAGLDVVVVEEGPHVTSDDFVGPAFDRFQRFCRDNATTQVLGRPPIPLPLGRVVGGTTVVNSGTCFRAPDRVLERWATEFRVEGATQDSMAEHFGAVEDALNVRPVPWELLGPNGMAAHRGAVALGYTGGPLLRNITDCHGCGQCAFGCPTNAKQAMHITFLPRAQRAGARIYSRCRVGRILMDDGRARGVSITLLADRDRPMGRMTIDASHVVVCAGAVHTPGLLAKSRVPDPSRQTGRNLRIHPATGVAGFFDEDVVNWKGTLQSYYIDAFFDSHEVMFEATTTVPSVGAGSLPGIGARAMAELGSFRKIATLGFYVSDTSKGRVRTLPNGEVVASYRLNEVDTRRLGVGLTVAAEVLFAAGAASVHLGLPGLDAITASEDLGQVRERTLRPGHLRLTAFHPMGTTRMGDDPSRSVVDSFGRHHAVQNLWVADASTFPTCVAVNPQITIMAFAKRTAERLAKG